MTDPIADLLTRLHNAVEAGHSHTVAPSSKVKADLLKILQQEGYVAGFEIVPGEPQSQLRVELKYDEERNPSLQGVKRISKPGRRVYTKAPEIPKVMGGVGIAIVSTSRGIMTGGEAYKRRLGGELLCFVW